MLITECHKQATVIGQLYYSGHWQPVIAFWTIW